MVANMLALPDYSVHAHAVRARCCAPVLPEADTAFAPEILKTRNHTMSYGIEGSGTTTGNAGAVNDLLAWVSAQEGTSSGSDSGRFSDDDAG